MKTLKTILIFTCLLNIGCINDNKTTSFTSDVSALDSTGVHKVNTPCVRCDTTIIENATEHYDSLSRNEIKAFLCSFDTSCNWKIPYKESGGNYDDNAFEMLIVLFNDYFADYLNILEYNKDINFEYLLKLFERPAIYDLPHSAIYEKLNGLKNKTLIQQTLYEAFKKSIKAAAIEMKKHKKE